MLISPAPFAVPVSTANPPTESVASEAAQKTPVPKASASSDNPNTRNSTQGNESDKTTLSQQKETAERDTVDSATDKEQQQKQQKEQSQQEAQSERAKQKTIESLSQTDREVRAHEAAHAASGGSLAGAPQLSYRVGPDGKRYAVAGEVSIDTSKVANNPQATLDKMSQVRRAALAPAEPSSQDLRVAAMANQRASEARSDLLVQRVEEAKARVAAAEAEKAKGETAGVQNEANDDSQRREFNPVAARRATLALREKIANSGAFEDINKEPLLSQSV